MQRVTQTYSTAVPQIFDRDLHAKLLYKYQNHFQKHSFLFKVASENTMDFLSATTKNFNEVLINNLFHHIQEIDAKNFIIGGLNLENLKPPSKYSKLEYKIFDEEKLPFPHNSFDLIISTLSLHFINDVPGVLRQYHNILKPGGLFIANFFGGSTLYQLKDALARTDNMLFQGIDNRIIPMINPSIMPDLMKRAGFSNAIIQTDSSIIHYSDLITLLKDIKYSGQGNCMHLRSRMIPGKKFFTNAETLYFQIYKLDDGKIPATFDIITLYGFK